MRIIFLLIMAFTTTVAASQTLESLLQDIEQNNPRLNALQKWLKAEQMKAKTGIYPRNPEVAYNYLFGSPEAIGDQKEFEITQSFKLPGYYTSKAAVQNLNFQQKQALAEKETKEVLHAGRETYFTLVWLQKRETLLESRNGDAEKLLALMEEGYEGGEISKPAFNKARIYVLNVQNEWKSVQSAITIQKQHLTQLNGGNSFNNLIYEYPPDWNLPVLDTILSNLSENSPELKMAQLNIKASEKDVQLQRINRLPSFEAGYKSETILDQKLRGVHAGISIPLWQDKNKVQHARLKYDWAEANYQQVASEKRTRMVSLYNEVQHLFDSFTQMQQVLEEGQLSDSYLELLQAGQISFLEYVVESEFLIDNLKEYLLKERNYYLKFSELKMMYGD